MKRVIQIPAVTVMATALSLVTAAANAMEYIPADQMLRFEFEQFAPLDGAGRGKSGAAFADKSENVATNPSEINGVTTSGNANGSAPTVITGVSATDNFYFDTDEATITLRDVTFWTLEETGLDVWDQTLKYAIWQDTGSDAPSDILVGSGEFDQDDVANGAVIKKQMLSNNDVENPVLATAWVNKDPNNPGDEPDLGTYPEDVVYDQYQYSFELESTVGLSGRTPYWLSIFLGQNDNLDRTPGILWQQTSATPLEDLGFSHGNPHLITNGNVSPPADPECPSQPGPWCNVNTNATASDLRFGLNQIPIPGTMLLVAPFVVFGIARRARRMRSA